MSEINFPNFCNGCGFPMAIDQDIAAPHETKFNVVEESDKSVQFECCICGTLTRVVKNSKKKETGSNNSSVFQFFGHEYSLIFKNKMEEHR